MNLKIKDTIYLDDNKEYAVASITKLEEKTYVYFVDINEFSNLRYCVWNEEKQKFEDITDESLIAELLPHFVLAAKDVILELSQDETL